MAMFKVVKRIEVIDWVTQEFLIELDKKEDIIEMEQEEFYNRCSFGEVIAREYGDTPTGNEIIDSVEEVEHELI